MATVVPDESVKQKAGGRTDRGDPWLEKETRKEQGEVEQPIRYLRLLFALKKRKGKEGGRIPAE